MEPQDTIGPREAYRARAARHGEVRDGARVRSARLSNIRAVTFLACLAGLLAFDVLEGPGERISLVAAAVLALIYAGQVAIHRGVKRTERWHGALADVANEGLLRLDRAWDALEAALPPAERPPDAPGSDHAYAHDLDLTGRASLVRLLGPVTSERGRRVLRRWLFHPGTSEEARARQGAVRELAPMADLRAELTAHGRLEGPKALKGIDLFLGWAEGQPWLPSRMWLRAAAWVLPATLVSTLVGDVFLGWSPWWLIPALLQLEVFRRVTAWAQATFRQAEAGGPPLKSVVGQLRLLDDRRWTDPLLASLGERWGQGDEAAHRHLERLSKLLDTVSSRRNLFYAALAPVLLLDVHLGAALDRWRARHGRAVRDWLEALGEWEAMSAMATVAHDHPDWADPTFVDGGKPALAATALGHPMLPPASCVRNDVTVGPPGSFLLVTGSNMSGKSTLLRALGANVVLALAGAPVCARALRLPAMRIYTSARIDDSLAEGISLFMAELLRIRGVVEAASAGPSPDPPVFFLLDEILHGTNTAERRVAARGVVRHLLASGAIGAVSTHDLTLADAPDLAASAVKVHFRERVEGNEAGGTRLTFDYRLRDGLATTRNALKLLEAVGLGDLDLDEDEA